MGAVPNADASMNMMKQVRKALGDIEIASQQGDVMKVYYITHCLREMVATGRHSWSTYRVMIAEEFEDN